MSNWGQSNAAAYGGPRFRFGAGFTDWNAVAEQLVLNLSNPDMRDNALIELSTKKEYFPELALLLWNSFGTIASLLQEIIAIYPVLSDPDLTPEQSTRVCNAVALLQIVASHQDTRILFLNAHIPLYLYPLLNTTSNLKTFEFLRLTSLAVIGALVKVDDPDVIGFLIETEIVPLCLRTMELGSELSKTRILLAPAGLEYVCSKPDRFFCVVKILANMVTAMTQQPSPRLLKHTIKCYLELSDHSRACEALQSCLPQALRDGSFNSVLHEDQASLKCLQQLLHRVQASKGVLQAGAYNQLLNN